VVSNWPAGQLKLFCVLLSQRRRGAPLGGLGMRSWALACVGRAITCRCARCDGCSRRGSRLARSTTWTQARQGARETSARLRTRTRGKRELQRLSVRPATGDTSTRRSCSRIQILFDPRDSGPHVVRLARSSRPSFTRVWCERESPARNTGRVRRRQPLSGRDSIYRSSRAAYAKTRCSPPIPIWAPVRAARRRRGRKLSVPGPGPDLGYLCLESRATSCLSSPRSRTP